MYLYSKYSIHFCAIGLVLKAKKLRQIEQCIVSEKGNDYQWDADRWERVTQQYDA